MSSNPGPIAIKHRLANGTTFSFAVGTKFKGRRAFQIPAYRLFYRHGCILGSPRLRTVRLSDSPTPYDFPITGYFELHCLPYGKEVRGEESTEERSCPCLVKLKFEVYALETPVSDITFEIVEFVNCHANHPPNIKLPKYKSPVIVQKIVKVRIDSDRAISRGGSNSGDSEYEDAGEEDELDSDRAHDETSARRSVPESSRSPAPRTSSSDDLVDNQNVQHLTSDFRDLSASPRRRISSANLPGRAAGANALASTSSGADLFGTKRRNPSPTSPTQDAPPAKQPKPNVTSGFGKPQHALTAVADNARSLDRARSDVGFDFLRTHTQPLQTPAQGSTSFGDFLRKLVVLDNGADYEFMVVGADLQEESHTLEYLTPYFEATTFRTQKRIEIQLPTSIETDVVPLVKKAFDSIGEGVIDQYYWDKIGELMEKGLQRLKKREGKRRAE